MTELSKAMGQFVKGTTGEIVHEVANWSPLSVMSTENVVAVVSTPTVSVGAASGFGTPNGRVVTG